MRTISSRPRAIKAEYNGICPMCHVYIRANLSPVIRLPIPLVPRAFTDEMGRAVGSVDTWQYYNADGSGINAPNRPRHYVHKRCYQKALKVLNEAHAAA